MKIIITDECVNCGACEAICPDVFTMGTTTALVRAELIKGRESDCIDAALICPVNAIWMDDISF